MYFDIKDLALDFPEKDSTRPALPLPVQENIADAISVQVGSKFSALLDRFLNRQPTEPHMTEFISAVEACVRERLHYLNPELASRYTLGDGTWLRQSIYRECRQARR